MWLHREAEDVRGEMLDKLPVPEGSTTTGKTGVKKQPGNHHSVTTPSASVGISQGWLMKSRAPLRSRQSIISIGSKKEHKSIESASEYEYFSTMTRVSGHGFNVRIYRREPTKTRHRMSRDMMPGDYTKITYRCDRITLDYICHPSLAVEGSHPTTQ